MSTLSRPAAEQRIRQHLVRQTVLILLAGMLWYGVWLEVMTARFGVRGPGDGPTVTIPRLGPATVFAFFGVVLALGMFGRQARTTSGLDRFTASVEADGSQMVAVVAAAAAIAALVHTLAASAAMQTRQLSIGGAALAAFLAWRVSCNRLHVERDGRDAARAAWRRQRHELLHLSRQHTASRRLTILTLTFGLAACTVTIAGTLTTIRLVATNQAALWPDTATSLVISIGVLALGVFMRAIYLFAGIRGVRLMQHLTIAVACAAPTVTAVSVVSATLDRPAGLVCGLALTLAAYFPPAVFCLARGFGGDVVTAIAVTRVRIYAVRRAIAQEWLFRAFDAISD